MTERNKYLSASNDEPLARTYELKALAEGVRGVPELSLSARTHAPRGRGADCKYSFDGEQACDAAADPSRIIITVAGEQTTEEGTTVL